VTVSATVKLLLTDLDNTLIDGAAPFSAWALDSSTGTGSTKPSWLGSWHRTGDGVVTRDVFLGAVRARYELNDTAEALVDGYHERYPSFAEPPPGSTIEAF
jgi:hypothetical protein